MILVVGPDPPTGLPGQVDHQHCLSTSQVLALLEEKEYTAILVQTEATGLNPFSLARHLRRTDGPLLTLVGPAPDHQRFWIERCGGRWVADMRSVMNFGEEAYERKSN